jgi:hypothetical protein
VKRETDLPELFGSPRHDLVDEPLRRGLVVGEPLVVGWEEPVSVAQFTWDVELPNGDHFGFFQGVPDAGEPASGHEPRQVIVFQIDEAVSPSQVNTPDIDAV